MTVLRSVSAETRFEMDPVKGSRFVGTVAPARTEEEALAVVSALRAEWPGANHHCWAWRLQDGRARSSDDGEPGGSAGRPILARLEGKDIVDVVVVVTRWFGGVKLGVGGLVRAYGGCAGKALDRAAVVETVRTQPHRLAHAYPDTGAVAAVLAELGLTPIETDYGAEVCLLLEIPEGEVARARARIRDGTGGRARLEAADADDP